MAFPVNYIGRTAEMYPGDFAPPFVDHLHERSFPHQSLFGYLAHRKPNLEPKITQPDIDIRDNETGYIIDIELPGVSAGKSIKIEWTSSRSLTVSGNTDRPIAPEATTTPKKTSTSNGSVGTRVANGEWVNPQEPEDPVPTIVVAERRIGPFRRHFNFPVDVDMEKLKAKLENGLLMISVPKRESDSASWGRLNLE